MLVDRYAPAFEPLFAELAPHVDAGALAELRNIVADIQQRVARVGRGGQAGLSGEPGRTEL